MKKNHKGKLFFFNKKIIVFIIFIIFSLTVLCTTNAQSSQEINLSDNTLYVGGTGENNYTHIQHAIENASSGNSIYVFNGIYYENVILDKELTLNGNNKENTIINAQGYGNVITVAANNCTISNFTIINSGRIDDISTNCGIYCEKSPLVIKNNNISENHIGIAFLQGSSTMITNNTISHNNQGIFLKNSSYINIINNTFIHNTEALILDSSYTNHISNCHLHKNNNGIYLYSSSHNNIQGCTFFNNSKLGIYFHYSAKNTVIKNIFENCDLDLIYSSNHTLINNIFTNGGISIFGGGLSGYSHTIDTSNKVNTHPLYYFLHQTNISLENCDIGQLILTNCSNFSLKNINIAFTNQPIEIAFSSHIYIENVTLHHSKGGARFYQSSNNTLSSCNIYNNSWSGVIFTYSSNNNLMKNSTVRTIGMYSVIISWHSNNNIISYCNITHNQKGINIMSSTNNLIYSNNFINNTQPAMDDDHNHWDNGLIGNYWSNFDNSSEGARDNNSDNIIDTCFPIPNGTNQDRFPLATPWNPHVNQKPLVQILYPTTYTLLNNTVIIKGTAHDIDGVILWVEINIDGGAWLKVSGTLSWNYSWDTTLVKNGDYILSVRSFDGISYSAIKTISLTVCNPYILTINSIPSNGGNVIASPFRASYLDGMIVNLTAIPFEGYGFSHWGGSLSGSMSTLELVMDSDKHITAYFIERTRSYTLSVTTNPSRAGIVILDPDYETFQENTVVMVTAVPNVGYSFAYWDGDSSSTNSSIMINITNNKTLVAYFEESSILVYPPIVYFSYSLEGQKVFFTDKSSDIDGFLVGWQWDFGDHNYSVQEHPIHTYQKSGRYNVTLVVTDNTGHTGTYTSIITIEIEKNWFSGFEWIYLLFVFLIFYVAKKRKY